jgi:hypothetical protein
VVVNTWSEQWAGMAERAAALEAALKGQRATTLRGGDFDDWDIEVRGGVLGGARVRLAVEEHGGGRQLVRSRIFPRISLGPALIASGLLAFGLLAWIEGEAFVGTSLLVSTAAILARQLFECGGAVALAMRSAGGTAGGIRPAVTTRDVAKVHAPDVELAAGR